MGIWQRLRGSTTIESKDAKQATGPGTTIWVLFISIGLAVVVGVLLYSVYFQV